MEYFFKSKHFNNKLFRNMALVVSSYWTGTKEVAYFLLSKFLTKHESKYKNLCSTVKH